jgi:hypothetical protein
MYHLELRKFPHNAAQFNLTEQEMLIIATPWARGEWVEVGERKWNPNEARLIILEGPLIPVDELSMGRGWPTAQRESTDVTDAVLAAQRKPPAPASQVPAQQGPPGPEQAGEEHRSELLSLLGESPESLLEAWVHAAALYRGRSPSESLALAEAALEPGGKQ